MELMRQRLEQRITFHATRDGVAAGRIPTAPTNHAYTPGATYGTANRLLQGCQLDAARQHKDIFMYQAIGRG